MAKARNKTKTAKTAGRRGGDDGSWDFIGRVESVNIKGRGANSLQCVFSLINKKGEHKSWIIEPFEVPQRFAAMTALLTAVAGAKTEVRLREDAGVAIELEIRPKTGRDRRA
jgi:hypothetical protein